MEENKIIKSIFIGKNHIAESQYIGINLSEYEYKGEPMFIEHNGVLVDNPAYQNNPGYFEKVR